MRRRTCTGQVVDNDKVDAFLEDIVRVCHQHGLVLGHYGEGFSFEVSNFNQDILDWILDAEDNTDLPGPQP